MASNSAAAGFQRSEPRIKPALVPLGGNGRRKSQWRLRGNKQPADRRGSGGGGSNNRRQQWRNERDAPAVDDEEEDDDSSDDGEEGEQAQPVAPAAEPSAATTSTDVDAAKASLRTAMDLVDPDTALQLVNEIESDRRRAAAALAAGKRRRTGGGGSYSGGGNSNGGGGDQTTAIYLVMSRDGNRRFLHTVCRSQAKARRYQQKVVNAIDSRPSQVTITCIEYGKMDIAGVEC